MSKQNQSKPQSQSKNLLETLDSPPPGDKVEGGLSTKDIIRVGIAQSCISTGMERFSLSGRVMRKKEVSKAILSDVVDMFDLLDEVLES